MKLSRILLLAAALGSTHALAASYTVKTGDTLYSIARTAGVDARTLMQLNGMSSSTIQVGQTLNLGKATAASAATTDSTAAANAAIAAVVNPTKTSTSTAAVVTPASSGGAYIRTAASRWLGIRYVHGGTSGWGLDCSGFTLRVFQNMGINLPRTAAAQWRSGYAVSRRDLRAGDLVFFNTTGRVASHVGIYLGNGMMANANSYYGRTMVEPLFSNSYWAARYVGARRVLN